MLYAWEGHATAAAASAGYKWPSKQGPRLKTFPAVRAALDALLAVYRWELGERDRERWREERRRLDAMLRDPARRRRRRRAMR